MTLQELENLITFVVDEKSKSDVENAMQGIKSTATKLLGAIGITLTLNGVKEFAQECAQVASDVQEMERKADAVFGVMADEADEWSESFANSIGRSKSTIKTYLTDMQNLFTGFTDGSDEAREACLSLSEMATQLAIDNASFDNVDEEVAIQRMTRAIMGQTEAARSMGAILDDTTRAEAMLRLGLSGTYKELDQYTKMTVNYEALAYQMKDAVGDAADSTEYFEGKARQLAASQQELKEVIGNGILPLMTMWNKIQLAVTEGEIKLAKAIFGDTDEESGLQQVTNWLSKTFDRLTTMLGKARDAFTQIADKLGGMENTIKIITILIGSLALVMNFETAVKAVQKVVDVFSKLNKVVGSSGKVMMLAAAIALVALVIEDFVNFMQGNDSLVGELFKKAGIDADEMRRKISNAFTNIGAIVTNIVEGMKEAFDGAFEAVKGFFAAFDMDIGGSLGEAIANLINLITGFIDTLAGSPEKAKAIGRGIVEGLGVVVGLKSAFGVFSGIIKAIGTVSKAFGALKSISGLFGGLSKAGSVVSGLAKGFLVLPGPVKIVIAVIAAVAAAAYLIYKNWGKVKPVIGTVVEAFKNFKESVSNAISAAGETITNVWNGIVGFFADTGNSIAETTSSVWNGITDAISAAVESARSVITTVWTTISGAVSAVMSAIWNTITSVWNGIYETIKPLLDAIGYLMETLWGAAGVLVQRALDAIWGEITAVWNAIVSFLTPILEAVKNNFVNIWNGITEAIANALSAAQSVVTSVWNAIAGFVVPIAEGIRDKAVAAWNALKDGIATAIGAAYMVITTVWSTVSGFVSDTVASIRDAVSSAWNDIVTVVTDTLNTIQTTVSSIWESVYTAVSTKISDIKNSIQTGFEEAVNYITGLASQAFNWGADIIKNIKQGIQSKIQEVSDAITGVADKIHSVLHFSVPDEGPLSDFDTYMPDMMNLMAEGITEGSDTVTAAVEGVANEMSGTTQTIGVGADTSGIDALRNKYAALIAEIKDKAYASGDSGAIEEAERQIAKLKAEFTKAANGLAAGKQNLSIDATANVNGADNATQKASSVLSGIKSMFSGASGTAQLTANVSTNAQQVFSFISAGVDSLKDKLGGIIGNIADDLHLSIDATANVNGNSQSAALDAITTILSNIQKLIVAQVPTAATVSTATSSSVTSRNVTQNVTISNKFEGEKAAQKKASSAMDRSAKDATSQMARALAYAR